MDQMLTCANHSGEDVQLIQVGWNIFACPRCGRDYSIGRKVIVMDTQPVQRR